jgi:hypothetical protein
MHYDVKHIEKRIFERRNMAHIVDEYIAHGWSVVPIPIGSKGPVHSGWNTRAAAIKSSEVLFTEGVGEEGVGLLHAYSGTMALDIDDWDRTLTYGINVNALYAAPDAVTILSGKQGRGKLLYRMPFGLTYPTKKVQVELGRDSRGHMVRATVFELRCATLEGKSVQDVLPPSIHPETKQAYQWGGAGHWSRLPMIPQQLLDVWQELIRDTRAPQVDGVDSSWDEIKDALRWINPDCSREDWIQCGMALHWAGEQTFNQDQAFAVWDGWSKMGTKYPGERVIAQQWASFRANKGVSVTLGTLFHLARIAGWTRPQPDASTLFSEVGLSLAAPTDILQSLRPEPPGIDLSLWPPILAKRAQEVSDGVGCDPIVPLFAGLGAVCGVIDAQSRLELMPGFKVPPVLWLMTIGDPADKKSPGSRPMLSPLKGIESSDRPRYAQELQAWKAKEAVWSVAEKAFLDFVKTPEALLGGEAPAVPPKPDQPAPLKITVNDITSQKLVHVAHQRPRGLLCYLDEMNSWVHKLTSPFSGEDRSCWTVSYESERYEMDRVGAGSVHCDNLAVSIYGNIQPMVFKSNYQALAADGLLQRFLPAVLRPDQTRLGNPIPDYLTSADKWENTLRMVYALPQIDYKLSQDAFAIYRAFQVWYEDQKQNERLVRSSDTFLTAFGKLEGLAGRLALVFHVIESPFMPTVSAEIMRRVIRIIREYVIPTYRYLLDGDGSMSAFDAWVVDHVIHYCDLPRLTLSEIKRSARRPFERASVDQPWQQNQWVLNSMHLLEQRGWVAREDDGQQEQRGIASWLINPALKTTFATHRKAVIQARKANQPPTPLGQRGIIHGQDELNT